MIAQLMAIFWQDRFCSFCSIASFTGNLRRQNGKHIRAWVFVRLSTSIAPELDGSEKALDEYIKHSTKGMLYTQYSPGASQNNGRSPYEECKRRYDHKLEYSAFIIRRQI